MSTELKDKVRSLPEEKYLALSEQYGWPKAYAEGFVSGQTARRRGIPLVGYTMVGVDQYALGFRAGYFGRPAAPLAPQLLESSFARSVEAPAVA